MIGDNAVVITCGKTNRLFILCKKSVDRKRATDYFKALIPGSSVVEQVTVNHLVAGSNPARGAITSQ